MHVKVLSLNIWRGGVLDHALEFLRKENPDVILLQEVYDGHDSNLPKTHRLFSFLKKELPDYHALFGAAYTDITSLGSIESGNAVFSKFKITASENTFFDVPYKIFNEQAQTSYENNPQTVLRARLDAGGVALNTFCMHGIWGPDGRDNPRRLKMADTVIEALQGKTNVILGGDFNLNADTETARKIEKHLISVFGTTLVSTFNMRRKKDPAYATAIADQMFVSPHIRIIEKICPDVDVSDHLPLIVTLEL